MKRGKDIILEYCSTVQTHDIDHLQNAIDNERTIKNDEYEDLSGCPMNYGLDNYEGLCETRDDYEKLSYKEQCEMCNKCWKQALESKID